MEGKSNSGLITSFITVICSAIIFLTLLFIAKTHVETNFLLNEINKEQKAMHADNRINTDSLKESLSQKPAGGQGGGLFGGLNPIAMAKELSPAAQAAKLAEKAMNKGADLASKKKEDEQPKKPNDESKNEDTDTKEEK